MSEIEVYVQNRMKRLNTPFVIINGAGFYREGIKLIPEKVFNEMYPLKTILNVRSENPDKTKLWMSN